MSKLELTGNMLNSLPELDGVDISSTEILLENNTFHCNCEINEFYKWVMKSKEKISKIECSAPQKFDGYNMLELKEREICDVTTTTTTTTTTKSTTTTTTKTTRKTTTPYSTSIFLPLPPGTRPPKTFIGFPRNTASFLIIFTKVLINSRYLKFLILARFTKQLFQCPKGCSCQEHVLHVNCIALDLETIPGDIPVGSELTKY